ncbi:MAG TPA: ribonuclease HI family protein [Terracidiphilus sp.]
MNGTLFDGMVPAPRDGTPEWLVAHCDGGSRGNPGPSGFGAVIEDAHGRIVARLSSYLGVQTNNYAEYSGLLAVLKWAVENGVKRLRVVSDSELMVKQMAGKYKVASPILRPLWEEARRLARQLSAFEMTHTLRAGNKEADRLANEAMDKGMGKTPGSAVRGAGEVSGAGKAAGPRIGGSATGGQRPASQGQPAQPKRERQVLEGYVKDGVVHLLEGALPDGIFVKVISE